MALLAGVAVEIPRALRFPVGGNSGVLLPNIPALDGQTAVSLIARVRVRDVAGTRYVFGKRNPSGGAGAQILLRTNNTPAWQFLHTGGTNQNFVTNTLPPVVGRWVWVAVSSVFGSSCHIYLGSDRQPLIEAGYATSTLGSSPDPDVGQVWRIGNRPADTTGAFGGDQERVQIYGRALSLAELREIQASGMEAAGCQFDGLLGADGAGARVPDISGRNVHGTMSLALPVEGPPFRRRWWRGAEWLAPPLTTETLADATLAFGFGVSATAVAPVAAQTTLPLAFGLAAAGVAPAAGTATLAFGFSAQATGAAPVQAVAAPAFGFGLNAAATAPISAAAGLAFGFGVVAAGTSTVTATATLPLSFGLSATGAGLVSTEGAATLPFAFGLSTTGVAPVQGASALAFGFGCTATAVAPAVGTGAVAFAWVVSGTGVARIAGAAALPWVFGGTASGTSPIVGSGTVAFVFRVAAVGGLPGATHLGIRATAVRLAVPAVTGALIAGPRATAVQLDVPHITDATLVAS